MYRQVGPILLGMLLFGLFVAPPIARAQSAMDAADGDDRAEAYYQRGIRHFDRGEYATALNYLRLAERLGRGGNDLIYDLAVTLAKLKRYRQAGEEFAKLIQHAEYGDRALYNRALMLQLVGDNRAALNEFVRAADWIEDEAWAELVNLKIQQLKLLVPDPQGELFDPPADSFRGSVEVSLLRDDNVTVAEAESFARGSSDASQIFLSGQSDADHSLGFVLFVGDYEVSGYDRTYLSGLYKYQFELGKQQALTWSVTPSWLQLNGEPYLNYLTAKVRWDWHLNSGTLQADVRLQNIGFDTETARPYAGTRQDWTLGWDTGGKIRWEAELIFSRYDRGALTSVLEENGVLTDLSSFSDYDADRVVLYNSLSLKFPGHLELSLGYQYGVQDYGTDYRLLLEDVNGVVFPRNRHRRDTTRYQYLELSYGIHPDWDLSLKYRNNERNSSIARYDYDQTEISIGVRRDFRF